jgi:hypothetical protein
VQRAGIRRRLVCRCLVRRCLGCLDAFDLHRPLRRGFRNNNRTRIIGPKSPFGSRTKSSRARAMNHVSSRRRSHKPTHAVNPGTFFGALERVARQADGPL